MFKTIKNILWINKKTYWDFDSTIWGYTFFWNSWAKSKISKWQLIELYTGYSFVCINAIAEWISWLDRKLLWAENRIDKEKQHKYSSLITNTFLEEVVWFLEITWTVYIKKEMFWKSIESLEVLRTDLVNTIKDTNGNILRYEYNINWTINKYYTDSIFVIKNFSPFKDWEWISPLSALGKQQSMDEAIIEWNWNFFKNNASTWTTLETDQEISQDNKVTLANKWKAEFMGANNAHKLAILDQWLKQNENKPWQKDMDFVNQRTMIRDEIFTVFRVPKTIVWITDWIGYTDRKVWQENFATFKLKPIALKIQQALNENLFKWIWYFSFINIVPIDTEQLSEDYKLWVISLNEYRTKRNYLAVKNGDETFTWITIEYQEEKKKKETSFSWIIKKSFSNLDIKEIDINQKRWENKILRTDKYEKEFNNIMRNIFSLQEKDILKKIINEWKKSLKQIKECDLIDETAYFIIYQSHFKNFFKRMIWKEWKIAIDEIWKYSFSDKNIDKWIWLNIKKFAKTIDTNTRKEIIKIVKQWVS